MFSLYNRLLIIRHKLGCFLLFIVRGKKGKEKRKLFAVKVSSTLRRSFHDHGHKWS